MLRRECARAAICRHVLTWSLEETVVDLSMLADAAQPTSVIAANSALRSLLDNFCVRLDQRASVYALTDSRLSRSILKLVALRAWMGDRRISRLHIPVGTIESMIRRR